MFKNVVRLLNIFKLCTYDARDNVFIVECLSYRVHDIFNQVMMLLNIFKLCTYDARNNVFIVECL